MDEIVFSAIQLEWDEETRRTNREWYGFDFEQVRDMEVDDAAYFPHVAEGEDRCLILAPIGDKLFAVLVTPRPPNLKVLSLREANNREMDRYEQFWET